MNIGSPGEAEKKAMCDYRRKSMIIAFIPVCSALLLAVSANAVLGQPCQANELAKLLASDGQANDRLGFSTDICGDTTVIGAPQNATGSTEPGMACVFERIDGVWAQVAKLIASDGVANDQFGYSVACSGDTIVVAAIYDEDNGWHSGSAYVFERPPTGWAGVMTETAKLVPSDGFVSQTFGYDVDIHQSTIVIGAPAHNTGTPGAAYVFAEPVAGGWASAPFPMNESAKLTASDGESNDRDGTSVAIYGSTAMFGSEYDGNRAGSVYVFNEPTGGWAGILTEEQKLTASDGATGDAFGLTSAICGETAVVGAPLNDANGSVYVFEQISGVWTETAKLTASDGVPNVYFGRDLACSDDTVVAGACYAGGTDLGSAYVFVIPDLGWASAPFPMNEDAKLLPSDQAPHDNFGYGLGVSGDTAIVGAGWNHNINGTDAGAVYVFAGLSDCNENGTLDMCDIAEGTSPDANGNGLPDECEAISLDIKPSSCPNPVNRGSQGVLPVAVVGTADFDVTMIDVLSVRLSRADGVGGEVAPNEGPPGPHSTFEDVATPFEGEACDCHGAAGDGIDDLSLKFRTSAVVAALLLSTFEPGDEVELVVTGLLLDGSAFTTAGDCIRIVPSRTTSVRAKTGQASGRPGQFGGRRMTAGRRP